MKKNLLKSVLLALMVLVGGSAWAQTTYDFEDGYALFSADSRIGVAVVEGTQTIYSKDFELDGKAVKFTGASNAQNGYSFSHFDFSSLCNQAAKVKVEFEAVLGNGARSRISIGDASVRGNGSTICSKNTYGAKGAIFMIGTEKSEGYLNGTKSSALLTNLTQKWLKVTVEVDEIEKKYTYSIVDKATSDVLYSNGNTPISFWNADAVNCTQIDFFGYINSSQMGLIDNLVITVTKDERPQADYTVKFVDSSSANIKDSETRSGAVGDAITILNADKDPLWNAEKTQKYYYSSDDSEGKTILADNSAVVTISYRDAAVYNWTLNAVNGNEVLKELATGTVVEDESYRSGYPKMIEYDGKWYATAPKTAGANAPATSYDYYIDFTAEGTKTVTYEVVDSIAKFFECEDLTLEGTFSDLNGYATNRYSSARAPRLANNSYVYTPAIAPGIYNVYLWCRNNNGNNAYTIPLYLRDNAGELTKVADFPEWAKSACTWNVIQGVTIDDSGKSLAIKNDGSSGNLEIDYIFLVKTGDYVAPITPAYGAIWEGSVALGNWENAIDIDNAYFKDFAQVGDIIRISATVAEGGDGQVVLQDADWATIEGADKGEMAAGEQTIDFVVTEAILAKLNAEAVCHVKGKNATITKVELVEKPAPFDPSTVIANANFEGEYTVYSNPSADRAIYQPAGWTVTYTNGNVNDMTALNSNDLAWNSFSGKPQLGETGGNNTYWIRERWGSGQSIGLSQNVTLPAGNYRLTADAFFNGGGGSATFTANGVSKNVTGNSTWANYKIEFSLSEETEVTIAFNLTQTVEAENVAAFDNFTLETYDPLASAKADLQAEITAAEALVESAQYADGKEEMNTAIEAAKTALSEATTAAELTAATDALNAAKAAFNKAQAIAANAALVAGATVENPVAAPFVVNGTFDTAGVTAPWKTTGGFQNQTTATNQNGAFTVPFFENWNGSAKANKMYQTIENIPNGVYKLNIAAFVETLANPNESQYVFANNDKTYLTTGEPTMYEVYTKVEDNTMEIGLEQTTATSKWMGIDNVSLTYYGSETTVAAAKNAAMLAEVAEALTAKQSVKTKAALQAAYDAFVAEGSDENKTALETALAAAKVSINSYKILEAGVLPDNSLEGWTCTNTQTFHINTWSTEGNSDGTGMTTPFIENWCDNSGVLGTGEIYYSLPGLDPGIYSFSALIRAYSEAGNEPTGASLFAGDREKAFNTGKRVTYNNALIGIYDNYAMTCEVGEDGIFKFGIKIAEERNFNWMAFKNCKVAYVGGAIDADAVAELAATMPVEPMNAEVKSAADAAIAAVQAEINLDNYEVAAKAIAAAQASAAAYKNAKAAIDAAKAVMANTNVYTQEAYEAYNAVYAEKEAAYEAGSLTDAEANSVESPATITGWRAANIVDNFLLSAWDATADDFAGGYYINTWSNEGENDGSNFKVPFFEYWTDNGESLGEKVMTATMNNLEAGIYDVTAWVRVRIKDGAEAPATGITLQVNEGEAANVAGEQLGTSQFYLKEVTATGTVAEDGVLKIKFNVAADNNVSWLSFKNVVYTKQPEPTKYNITIAETENGQVVTDKATAAEGEKVTVTVTPAEGYMVNEAYWMSGENKNEFAEPEDGKSASFVMPANDVTITVTFKAIPVTEAPTFSAEEGEYLGGVTVKLTSATEGAAIYYTLDGTEPTAESALYSEAITITETTTVKAIAIKSGVASTVAEATYTISQPVYAENCLYSWESPSGFALEYGGTIAGGNDEDRINYAQANYYTFCLRGKADFSSQYVTITLSGESTMNAGDTIAITAFRNKDVTGKKAGAKLQFSDNTAITSGDGNEFVNLNIAVAESTEYGTEPNTVNVIVPEAATGCNSFKMTRSQTGTNLFITKLEILKKATATGINELKAADRLNGTIFNLNGQKIEKAKKGLYIINGKKTVIK